MFLRFAGVLAVAVLVAASLPAAPVPPGGTNTVAVSVGASATSGFVTPGSKIDLIGVVRNGNKLEALSLLVDVLVVAVDVDANTGETTVSVSVTDKQAKALALAKRRGCPIDAILRNPDKRADNTHDLDAVIKRLSAPEVAPAPRPVG